MKNYKLVIYDCDGVLLDTLESNYIFYNRVMEYLGRPHLKRDDLVSRNVLHTFSFNNVMDYFFGNDERKDDAWAFAKTIHYKELSQYMKIEEELIETLVALKNVVQLAVCTNRASSMDMIIEDFGLEGFFSFIMTADQVENPKPHPEPLFKVLEHFGVKADEALFIGDGEVDMLAARAAGVPFIAYKTVLPAMARIERHSEILSHVSSK